MAVLDGGRLVLVRHAMPQVAPDIPSQRWTLGDEGRMAARALRPLLPQRAYLVASDEPKAVQTLQELAGRLDVVTDPGFAEVRRPHVWSGGHEYRSLARAYLEGARHRGWEPQERVAQRFAAAVSRHARFASAAGSTLVIGTHGLAPTVWLAGVLPLHPSAAQFWEDLRFPDVIDVDLSAGTASRRQRRLA